MDYGVGSDYKIDTNKSFHVKTEFYESEGKFTSRKITLSQGSKYVAMSTGDCDYLQNMSSDLTQMVFVLSSWGMDNADWLQHGVCSGSCDHDATWTLFENLTFTTTNVQPAQEPSQVIQ